MRRKKLINKKQFKRVHNFCPFCGQTCKQTLHVHRWKIQGKDGGKYTQGNCISSCASCHSKLHANKMTILGVHYSTSGQTVVIYRDNQTNEQFIKPI